MKVTLVVAVILLGTACALKCYDGCTTYGYSKYVADGEKQDITAVKDCPTSTEKECATGEVCGNVVLKGELTLGDKKYSLQGNNKFCVAKEVEKKELTEAECTEFAAGTITAYPGAKITCGKLLQCEEELCNSGHKMTAAGALLLIAMIAQLVM